MFVGGADMHQHIGLHRINARSRLVGKFRRKELHQFGGGDRLGIRNQLQ